MSQQLHQIPVGIDKPKQILIWQANHFVFSAGVVGLFSFMNQTLLGLVIGMICLKQLSKFSDNTIRGLVPHYLWRLGFPLSIKGFSHYPPAIVTRFDA